MPAARLVHRRTQLRLSKVKNPIYWEGNGHEDQATLREAGWDALVAALFVLIVHTA
jgi:hypothetical protein